MNPGQNTRWARQPTIFCQPVVRDAHVTRHMTSPWNLLLFYPLHIISLAAVTVANVSRFGIETCHSVVHVTFQTIFLCLLALFLLPCYGFLLIILQTTFKHVTCLDCMAHRGTGLLPGQCSVAGTTRIIRNCMSARLRDSGSLHWRDAVPACNEVHLLRYFTWVHCFTFYL